MSETTVWAFQPLKELKNETGFVACDHDLADKLVASGKVQDTRVGALHFKEITSVAEEAPEEVKEEAPVEAKAEAPKPVKKPTKATEGDK